MGSEASCTVCAHKTLTTVIDFGEQPIANRFVPANELDQRETVYPLGLGYCPSCKTVQLSHRMCLSEVSPRFSWLVYNEPERHLDAVVDQLCKLPGIGPSSNLLGLTYKDQSTLDRLAKRGFPLSTCWNREEFSIFRSPPFSSHAHIKPVKLLLARHIVEHSVDAVGLMKDLTRLIVPDGFLVIELPDSEKILQLSNHAFIWEEHMSYFTEQSLPLLAEKTGVKLIWSARYSYNYEDSLVAIFQCTPFAPSKKHQTSPLNTQTLLDQFNQGFIKSKVEWKSLLQNYRSQGSKIAVFGAGHLAIKWINFLEVSDYLDCVIDDHPHKIGMYMPGSKLPILPSSALEDRKIRICISTLSPESEQKVRAKLSPFFDHGGIFIPAFKTVAQGG